MLQFFTTEKEEEMSDADYYFRESGDDQYIIATQGRGRGYFSSAVLARLCEETGKQMPDCTYAAVKGRRELEETILEREKAFLEAQARAAEAAAQAQARAAEAAAQAQARAAEAAAQARAAAAEAPPPCYREGDSLQMHTSEGAAPPPYTASIGVTSV